MPPWVPEEPARTRVWPVFPCSSATEQWVLSLILVFLESGKGRSNWQFPFPSSGEQTLAASVSPGNKATLAFTRKQKKIPAALKEVTHGARWHPVVTTSTWQSALPGVGEHRFHHEWVSAEVEGQQKAVEEAVVCHQRQGPVHVCRQRGQLSRQPTPQIDEGVVSDSLILSPHRTWLPWRVNHFWASCWKLTPCRRHSSSFITKTLCTIFSKLMTLK